MQQKNIWKETSIMLKDRREPMTIRGHNASLPEVEQGY